VLLESSWKFYSKESILGIELLNLSQNDQMKILAFSKKGNLFFLSLDGLLIKKESVSENPIWTVKVFDIDNDGVLEIIIGGMDGILKVYKIQDTLLLDPYWAHKFASSISGILIKDINDNGKTEVISYSLDKSIRVLDPTNGNLIWGQLFEDGIEDAIIWDINESISKHQIIACGNDGTIRAFALEKSDLLWFKRFSDKIRLINYINSNKGTFIICGGDDKQLHFIDRETHEEIKTIQFENYVWKGLSFPTLLHSSLLVSSYSFDYLENSQPIQDITFSSKLICIDGNLEIVWELPNKNIEEFIPFQINHMNFIAIGTTQGELLILDENNGVIKYSIKHNSCVNSIKYELKSNSLLICYEDGLVEAFQVIYD
jgi:WD40 repeat protein